MLNFQRFSVCLKLKDVPKLLDVPKIVCVPFATVMKLQMPPNYAHIKYPDKRRMSVTDKTPQTYHATMGHAKMTKMVYLMRGPEKVHNRIQYGEYGIQALQGGRLKHAHFHSIRSYLIRKLDDKKTFTRWRVDAPWQAITKKGQGIRMGNSKGGIKHWETPIKPGRIIFEVGGEIELVEIEKWLNSLTHILPFKNRIVSRKMLEEEILEEERTEKLNQNPFTFEYCAKKNYLGIKQLLSPYDYKWHGKYR